MRVSVVLRDKQERETKARILTYRATSRPANARPRAPTFKQSKQPQGHAVPKACEHPEARISARMLATYIQSRKAAFLHNSARPTFSNMRLVFQDQSTGPVLRTRRFLCPMSKLQLPSSARVALWCGNLCLFKPMHSCYKALLQHTLSLE